MQIVWIYQESTRSIWTISQVYGPKLFCNFKKVHTNVNVTLGIMVMVLLVEWYFQTMRTANILEKFVKMFSVLRDMADRTDGQY